MSRLSIEIDPIQHRQIKTLATFSGLSIKEYILQKTLNSNVQEHDTTRKLLSSRKNAQRLRDALQTSTSKHHVFKSIKELQNALGI